MSQAVASDAGSAGRRMGPRLLAALPWLLVLLLTALNLLHASHAMVNDDAYITYRTARNLAHGLGPVFNPGERVLSVTTPGYMLLLAASSLFSQDFVALALLWNGLGLLAVGALLIDASRAGLAQRSPALANLAALVAVALTLANPLLGAAIGMETPLYLAALLATFAAYRRALQQPDSAGQRWLLATAAAAAAAFLLRPDGVLVGLVVGLHWLIVRRRVPWAALAVGLLLALPWVLFAWGYFGSPLPNTLAAKISQGLPDRAGQWGQQLLDAARAWLTANPLAAALALLGGAAALRPATAQPAAPLSARRLLLLWAVLYMAIHALLRVRGYFWYYVPLLPVAALLAGDGAAALAGWLANVRQATRPWQGAKSLLTGVLLLALLLPPLTAAASLVSQEPPGQRELAYGRTGLLLRALCQQPGHEPVGMSEIGILGYISHCQVLDFSGLLQPMIAQLRLTPLDKMAWSIKSQAPPLVVLAGSSGFPHELEAQPWFRQRYEPLDIQDERGFLSVIYRRAMGPATQRDLAAVWPQPAATEPLTTALVFPLGVTPAITLHTFLSAGSSLTVDANGARLATLSAAGPEAVWQDVRLPDAPAVDGVVALALSGQSAGQPAAVAWVESNAIPSLHYFGPFVEAAAQPRPRLELLQGDRTQATLAAPGTGPAVLDIAFRDLPGVQLEVYVDGQRLGVAGRGSGPWQVARFELPAAVWANKRTIELELRNPAPQLARVYYAALVDPARPPYVP
ncbi:MAG: hypothetical protein IAE85_01720 [Anaerolinea sp.]|nr:hypothetical protein [Anaerolinea sp.]